MNENDTFMVGDFVYSDSHRDMKGTVIEVIEEYVNELGEPMQRLRIAWFGFVGEEYGQDVHHDPLDESSDLVKPQPGSIR